MKLNLPVTVAILAVAGMLCGECQAGAETRRELKENTKEVLEKARATAREVAAETKELAQKGTEKVKELAGEAAEHARAGAKRVAEISKDVAGKTREVAVETRDKFKAKVKGVRR